MCIDVDVALFILGGRLIMVRSVYVLAVNPVRALCVERAMMVTFWRRSLGHGDDWLSLLAHCVEDASLNVRP